jgi:hypothetical protein
VTDIPAGTWEPYKADDEEPESVKDLVRFGKSEDLVQTVKTPSEYTVQGELMASRYGDEPGTVRVRDASGIRVLPEKDINSQEILSAKLPVMDSLSEFRDRIMGARASRRALATKEELPPEMRAATRQGPVQRALETRSAASPMDENLSYVERKVRLKEAAREAAMPTGWDPSRIGEPTPALTNLTASPEGGPAYLYDTEADLEEAKKRARARLDSSTSDDYRRDLALSMATFPDQTMKPVQGTALAPTAKPPKETPMVPEDFPLQAVPAPGIPAVVRGPARRGPISDRNLSLDTSTLKPQTLTPEQAADMESSEDVKLRRILEEKRAERLLQSRGK